MCWAVAAPNRRDWRLDAPGYFNNFYSLIVPDLVPTEWVETLKLISFIFAWMRKNIVNKRQENPHPRRRDARDAFVSWWLNV
jgi:hypothetical protein